MELHGITLDFDDIKTCGLLPDLCSNWDHRSEELSEIEALSEYWDNNINTVLEKTNKIIIGNMGNKSIIYSADKNAILVIKDVFKELELSTISYTDIDHYEHYITHDYFKYCFLH